MALTKYRLINVEGLQGLDTASMGYIALDRITDSQANLLHMYKSRYIEKLPDPEPAEAPPVADPVPAKASGRKRKTE